MTRLTGLELARYERSTPADVRAGTQHGVAANWPTPEPQHFISQIFLEPVLRSQATGQWGVDLREGWELAGFTQEPDGVTATVRDVMTHVIYAVRPSDPVMSAVRLMVMQNVHRAIVVRDEGRLAGVISSMDVLRALEHGEHLADEPGSPAAKERHAEPAVAVGYVDLRALQIDD